MKSVTVFCGSSSGFQPEYAEAAAELARRMVDRGLRLVYGGGRVGLMGIIADEVMKNGGEVIGIIPEALDKKLEEGESKARVIARDVLGRVRKKLGFS